MKNYFSLTIVVLALLLSGACSTAKKTGTTVKEGTAAAGKEVADKAEDVAEATGKGRRCIHDVGDQDEICE